MKNGIYRSIIICCALCFQSLSIWAAETDPVFSKSQHIQFQESVSQHGITWKFDGKVPVGQFVNGDYYVVGTATIVSITPKPEYGRNGSVLNLPNDPSKSGFDNRVSEGRYDPGLTVQLPVRLRPGDALISTISVKAVGELPAPLRPQDKSISPVRVAAVLTCLDSAIPRDAFRPSYGDRKQKIFLARNLKVDSLPNLARVTGGLDYDSRPPSPADWAEMFRRPWLDVCFFGFDAPIEYMPNYGREIGRATGIASLLLMLDFPRKEKERLLIFFVQYGIDLWGLVRSGHRGWPAHGGHGSGRKWPILFSGMILGDEEMQSLGRKFPNIMFGEDMQTMKGAGWTGATALYAGHVGRDGLSGKVGWGAYEHLHPSKWVSNIGENYRRCCTSISWVGQALAARIMNAEKLWAHDPFFDYVDRWMTEDDSRAIQEIKNSRGWDYSADWSRQRQAWDPFVTSMWNAYRYKQESVKPSDLRN